MDEVKKWEKHLQFPPEGHPVKQILTENFMRLDAKERLKFARWAADNST